jgi:hypothetical protein
MKNLKWDVLMDDTDYKCATKLPGEGRVYAFVEVMDMDDACGKDNEGHDKYCLEVAIVDLDAIGSENIRSALDSYGWTGSGWSGLPDGFTSEQWRALPWEDQKLVRNSLPLPDNDLAIAEACFSHGNKAPVHSESSNNRGKLIAEGRREAREMSLDEDLLENRMGKVVNKLGSTAAEFMTGDIQSAVQRGVEKGEVTARIFAKMYGVPQDQIDRASDQRPSDWLPYMAGYMDGRNGSKKPGRSPKVAPEYHQGYERGAAVAAGTAVPPTWLKGPNQQQEKTTDA